jgi:hypothetical protein
MPSFEANRASEFLSPERALNLKTGLVVDIQQIDNAIIAKFTLDIMDMDQ